MARTKAVYRPRSVDCKRSVEDVYHRDGVQEEEQPLHVESEARQGQQGLPKRRRAESGLSGQGQVVTSGTYYYHAVHPNNNSPRRPTPTTALTAAAQRAFNDEQQPAVPSNDEPFVQPTSPPTTEVIPLESAFNEVAKARQIHVAAKESLREAVDWTVSLTAKAAEATRHASSTQDLVNDLKMSAREHTRRAQESARTVASLQRDLLQLKERAAAAKARDESLATHTAEVEGLLRMKVERLARLGEKQHAQENRVVGLQVATWRYLEGRIMSEGNTVSHSEEGGAGNMLNVLALASLAEGVGAEELKGLHLSYEVDKTDLHDHIQEQAVAADKHREAAAGVAECEALLASAAHETEKARARAAKAEQDVVKVEEKLQVAKRDMLDIKRQQTEAAIEEEASLANAHETRRTWHDARSARDRLRRECVTLKIIHL